MKLIGRAHCYGHNIDTDRIIPGKYTKTLDGNELAAHVLEDLDPDFRHRLTAGDLLVAGENFGCGSSREQAPLALKFAGVGGVIAQSFARIFFRNAINVGLPVFEIPNHEIASGACLEVDTSLGAVWDGSRSMTYQIQPLPEIMALILGCGGLVPYLRQHGSYQPDRFLSQ